MYATLLILHSITRWLVLGSLILAIFLFYRGWILKRPFTAADNRMRHITATIAHIQMTLGIWLYVISPVAGYFLANFQEAVTIREARFFGMEHSVSMLLAVIFISVGSSSSKRKSASAKKFKTLVICFSIALIIIFLAIPWPFSPLSAHRPYFRFF